MATLTLARKYWDAATELGIAAAPLHLRDLRIEAALLRRISTLRQPI